MRRDDAVIVFLHVVKTAGTTLHRIIEQHYQAEEDYSLREPNHQFEDFPKLTTEEKARLRMVRGHMIVGIHEHLSQPATYFTLLREPVERTISYYHHIRRSPDHHAREAIVSQNMDLREAIRSGVDLPLANGQTRVLPGGRWHNQCTPEALGAAKQNLQERFPVVVLGERFDETLLLLGKAFGWRDLFCVPQNVSQRRPAIQDLSPQVLDTVRSANQID
jgi:hypothetical protein